MLINVDDFNIKILKCIYFDGSKINTPIPSGVIPREVYDYEIEFYTDCGGGILINGKFVRFEKGNANFRRPGQSVGGVFPYSCYCLCFDILGLKDDNGYDGFGNKEHCQPNYNSEILNNINDKVVFDNPVNIENIFKRIYKNYDVDSELSKLELKIDMLSLLREMCAASEKREYNIHVKRAVEYIKENLAEDFNISDLADYLSLTPNYLQFVFKRQMGITPNSYITKRRLEKAKFLLINTGLSIAEVGSRCGFLDNVYFSYVFSRNEGLAPSRYREKYI